MKSIGGFFELEIATGNSLYHDHALGLSTGRACLNYILKLIKPSKVFLPYYCCDALFEPIVINSIDFEFYSIDEQLEIKSLPELKANEVIICVDFFGIKTKYINSLLDIYKSKLVVDNTHSYFLQGYKRNNYSFTSARKYFGVPDGAFLYVPEGIKPNKNIDSNTSVSIDHNVHRLIGLQEQAYLEYVDYEKGLNSEIEQISILSEKILSTINYAEVRKRRDANFKFFQEEFGNLNRIDIDGNERDCFCFPLLLDHPIDKKRLFNENIFIPSLWLDTLNRSQKEDFRLECMFSNELLPMPIDHRYSFEDLQRVSDTLKKIMYE